MRSIETSLDVESTYAAAHDPLTGLPNREHLAATLDAMAEEHDDDLALVVVEIDALADVDARCGRRAGDALVVDVARRVERVVGPWAVVGQLARDRIALIVPGVDVPLVLRRVRREMAEAAASSGGRSAAGDLVERVS